jgi:hypothetical protein
MYYNNSQEIRDAYDPLYKNVFFDDHIYYIFNDEHDYELTEKDTKDVKIMLTFGHYYLLEEQNMTKARYYYNKVTELGSPLGQCSLAIFFFLEKNLPRSKLCAINGANMGCTDCTTLLFNIYTQEKKYDQAEQCMLDEIERLDKIDIICVTNDKLKLVENLCMFHLNITTNGDALIKLANKYIKKSDNVVAILSQYYYNVLGLEKLAQFADMLILKNMLWGNYYMGLHSYGKFAMVCKNGINEQADIEHAIEFLENANMWLTPITESNELQIIKDKAQTYIDKIDGLLNHFNNVIIKVA